MVLGNLSNAQEFLKGPLIKCPNLKKIGWVVGPWLNFPQRNCPEPLKNPGIKNFGEKKG